MYARLCSATGWSWEYVGESVTLPRLYAFLDYWKTAPPVAESVAAFIGIKSSRPPPEAECTAYMQNLPAKVVRLPR